MALAAPAACNSRALFDCLAGGPREAWPGHHLNLELPLKRCEETHRFLARDVSIAGLQCVSDGDSSSFVAPFYDAVREREAVRWIPLDVRTREARVRQKADAKPGTVLQVTMEIPRTAKPRP